jgi:hypothetical protein
MPGGDRTGPLGDGPMTGRQLGWRIWTRLPRPRKGLFLVKTGCRTGRHAWIAESY